ncbi:hypothetical protein [Thalassococcus sp. S3]|uniref:hypothetical protein n=1 Tax=Thalassococcus sp. S3 TaxID=2017482 RepID=UPI00102BDB8C|nr:hypothetical protein [Thalassococcus sp. S3]
MFRFPENNVGVLLTDAFLRVAVFFGVAAYFTYGSKENDPMQPIAKGSETNIKKNHEMLEVTPPLATPVNKELSTRAL